MLLPSFCEEKKEIIIFSKKCLTRGKKVGILTKLARGEPETGAWGRASRTLKTIQKRETRNRKETAKIPKSLTRKC